VSVAGVVRILVAEDGLTAQGVDEGCPTYNAIFFSNRRPCSSGKSFRAVIPVPEAPQTIKQN
jgi:hypothetical protein